MRKIILLLLLISSEAYSQETYTGSIIDNNSKEIIPFVNIGVVGKNIGIYLKEKLDNFGINKLMVVGLTTNHCVSTTTRMAGNFGFDTLLISDATVTFERIGINGEKFSSELINQTTLANLNNQFTQVINTEKLLGLV